MGQLIYFELRKNFLRKSVLIVLAMFFFMNIANIYVTYRLGLQDADATVTPYNITPICYKYYTSLHNKYDGRITRDKISEINEHYEELAGYVEEGTYSKEFDKSKETGYLFGDYYYLGKYIYSPMKYSAMYATNMKKCLEKIRENKEFYKKAGNKAYEEKYSYLEKKYSNRIITSFFEVDNWSFLFEYKFSELLVLLLLLFGTIPMFDTEKTTGMYDIIMSNYKGKKSYYIHKFIALLLYTILVTMLFTISDYVLIHQLFGLKGAFRPLYCIPKFQFTVLNCSLLGFYVLCSFWKMFGYLVIALCIGKISQWSNGIVTSYLCSLIFLVAGLYLSGFCVSEMPLNQCMSLVSPFTLLKGNMLYTQALDTTIGEHYFVRGQISLLVQAVIFIFLMGSCIYQGMRKRQVSRKC